MRFPLIQLYGFNESKPIVEVEGIDNELQWDTCNLRGLEKVSKDFNYEGHTNPYEESP